MSNAGRTIDEIDRSILTQLQRDARVANAEIARQVGMAPSAVLERVRKLEERGIVRGYEARLDPRAVDAALAAFVFVRAEERVGSDRTALALAELPGVQEVHHIAGEDCFLVKVRAADTEALGDLLRDGFGAIPTVRSTRTTIVLRTIKETATLPIPAPAADAEEVRRG
jgi:Lrp/AsnC family transcriptional regulator, leucine-responsive regulatory protein